MTYRVIVSIIIVVGVTILRVKWIVVTVKPVTATMKAVRVKMIMKQMGVGLL